MRQERREKVWSVRGGNTGRRRRRQEEEATAGAGKGLRQGEWKEGGGAGEGQHKRGQHSAAPQGDGTEKVEWQGPRDGPRRLGQQGRRHRRGGRGRGGSDPC